MEIPACQYAEVFIAEKFREILHHFTIVLSQQNFCVPG